MGMAALSVCRSRRTKRCPAHSASFVPAEELMLQDPLRPVAFNSLETRAEERTFPMAEAMFPCAVEDFTAGAATVSRGCSSC